MTSICELVGISSNFRTTFSFHSGSGKRTKRLVRLSSSGHVMKMQNVSEILQVVLRLARDSLRVTNGLHSAQPFGSKGGIWPKIYSIVQKKIFSSLFIHTVYMTFFFFFLSGFNEIALAEFPHQVIKCTVSPTEREAPKVSVKVKLAHSWRSTEKRFCSCSCPCFHGWEAKLRVRVSLRET